MKKVTSLILGLLMAALLLSGCGKGESGSPAAESGSTAPVETEEPQEASSADVKSIDGQSADGQSADGNSETPVDFALFRQTTTDEEGNIITQTTYDKAGDTICTKIQYLVGEVKSYYYMLTDKKYDDKGIWTGSTVYFFGADDLELQQLESYKTEANITAYESCTYNEDGYIVERTNADGSPNSKYTYNSDGQRIRESFYLSDVDDWRIIEKKYNEQGVHIASLCETPNYELKVENTAIGKIPLQTLYATGADLDHSDTMELTYDDKGVPVKGVATSASGKKTEYSFEVDEYGNLISSTSKDSDGNVRITKYELRPLYEQKYD